MHAQATTGNERSYTRDLTGGCGALRVGSLFSGIGGLDLAVEEVFGATTAWHCEVDPNASKVLAERWPGVPNLGDVTAVDWSEVEPVDIICGGSPCFSAGTLVDTTEGYRPIETVRIGDLVRTHAGRYMPVRSLMRREASDTVAVKVMGVPEFLTTPEHPFYVRRMAKVWDNTNRRPRRVWAQPEWVDAGDLDPSCFVGFQMDEPDGLAVPLGRALAYLIGRWLGDGWVRTSKRTSTVAAGRRGSRIDSQWWQVFICCAHEEALEVGAMIAAAGFQAGVDRARTVTKFRINSKALVKILEPFGRGAAGKRIPGWVYRLPSSDQEAMWLGWSDADGSTQASGQVRVTTISEELAHGMARVARNVYGRAVSVHRFDVPPTTVIEGRVVRQQPQFQVCLPVRNREAFVEAGWCWTPVRSVAPAEPAEVFNFSVSEDETYTAWGITVHNCQDLSSAGARAGMRDGTRSGLWASMCRAIEVIRPRFVIWENVRGALSACAASDLEPCPRCVGGAGPHVPVLRASGRVLGDLANLGFDAEWIVLSASEVDACHQRKRIFVLAWDPSADTGRVQCPPPWSAGEPSRSGCDTAADSDRIGCEGAIARSLGHDGRSDTRPDGLRLLPTPRATRGGSATETVELLPTPTHSLGGSRGTPNPETARRRIEDEGRRCLDDAVSMLRRRLPPSPSAAFGVGREFSGESAYRSTTGTKVQIGLQDVVDHLLPTPGAHDSGNTPENHLRKKPGRNVVTSLQILAEHDLFPSGGDPTAARIPDRWGRYAAAIARHEAAFGRPAPSPTDEKGRLSAAFAEWMMGYPPGWVTDILGRTPSLRAIGNGVVSAQAAAALRIMAASADLELVS